MLEGEARRILAQNKTKRSKHRGDSASSFDTSHTPNNRERDSTASHRSTDLHDSSTVPDNYRDNYFRASGGTGSVVAEEGGDGRGGATSGRANGSVGGVGGGTSASASFLPPPAAATAINTPVGTPVTTPITTPATKYGGAAEEQDLNSEDEDELLARITPPTRVSLFSPFQGAGDKLRGHLHPDGTTHGM